MSFRILEAETTRYRVDEEINTGGYGKIHKAKDLLNPDRKVVAKVMINPQDELGKKCEINGCEMIRNLNCDNIMKVYDIIHRPDNVFMILERLKYDLDEYLNRKYPTSLMPFPQVKCVARGILNALKTLKEHSIVHLDLRPENIMISSRSGDDIKVKLIDFGMGFQKSIAPYDGKSIQVAEYRAPEIYLHHNIGEPVDMFSLGLTLIELLCGKQILCTDELIKKKDLKLNRQGSYDRDTDDFHNYRFCKMSEYIEPFPQDYIIQTQNFKQFFTYNEETKEFDLPNEREHKGLEAFLTKFDFQFPDNRENYLDLLFQMIRINPDERITPDVALEHPLFITG